MSMIVAVLQCRCDRCGQIFVLLRDVLWQTRRAAASAAQRPPPLLQLKDQATHSKKCSAAAIHRLQTLPTHHKCAHSHVKHSKLSFCIYSCPDRLQPAHCPPLTATVPASAPTVMSNTAGLIPARPGAPRASAAAPTTSSSLTSYGQLSRQYGTKPKYSERGPEVRSTWQHGGTGRRKCRQ